MLLATATAAGTPRLIMPGVRTNAPPDPMKPLTRPPIKPTMNRNAATPQVTSINFIPSSNASCMLLSSYIFQMRLLILLNGDEYQVYEWDGERVALPAWQ
jgi:hypothetical protein